MSNRLQLPQPASEKSKTSVGSQLVTRLFLRHALLLVQIPLEAGKHLADFVGFSSAPAISSGDGHAVTGRYVTRRVDEIARVEMQDETGRVAVLEGTPIHPIWSVDRHDWVPLGELEAGELLQGENGLVTVLSVEVQARSVRVYNLEIHGEHVYEVGEFGVLVHNSGECTKPFWKLFEEIREKVFGEKVVRGTGGNGVDLVLENGTMVELKAWSHLVWERLSGSARNQNMLADLEKQLRRYLTQNTDDLVVEFAWKIPAEVLDVLGNLKGEFGDRIRWFGDVLQNGGYASSL